MEENGTTESRTEYAEILSFLCANLRWKSVSHLSIDRDTVPILSIVKIINEWVRIVTLAWCIIMLIQAHIFFSYEYIECYRSCPI